MTTVSSSVSSPFRASVRDLSVDERKRRIATVRAAAPVDRLRAVVAAMIGCGEWRSNVAIAEHVFVVDDRRFRRWISGEEDISTAALKKVFHLAWSFGVEVLPEQ